MQNKQAMVIGLGQFGMSVARALSDRGIEVMAIDTSADRVRTASQFTAEVACFDATDTEALGQTAPERRDVCVVAIGDDNREASMICTALLRQMGAKRVVARANDDLHARILTLIGAHQVVNPERAFGERFASQLVHAQIIGEMPLGADLLITELTVPKPFLGQNLTQLSLPKSYGVTVVAIRPRDESVVLTPSPTRVLQDGDVLVVVSRQGAASNMMEKVQE